MDKIIQILKEDHCDIWDVAEYMLLAEESKAGKQDAAWEARWKRLSKRSTGYVNTIYKNRLEYIISSDLLLQYLAKEVK